MLKLKNLFCEQMRSLAERDMAAEGSTGNMDVIEGEFVQNKQAVIELLIRNCMNVDTSIPRVVRGKFEEEENM